MADSAPTTTAERQSIGAHHRIGMRRDALLGLPRSAAINSVVTTFLLLSLYISTIATASSQHYIVCRELNSKRCITLQTEFKDEVVDAKKLFDTNTVYKCYTSNTKPYPGNPKLITVTSFGNGSKRRMYCKSIDYMNVGALDVKTIVRALEGFNRIRRDASYSHRGRFRGQTQSQYLAIDRGSGKDEGKAEAHSAADSSRATVSGNSGMGQAQSQSMYDPSCEDCVGRSDLGAESLKHRPGETSIQSGTPGSTGFSNVPNGMGGVGPGQIVDPRNRGYGVNPNQGGSPGTDYNGQYGHPGSNGGFAPGRDVTHGGSTLFPSQRPSGPSAQSGFATNPDGTSSGMRPPLMYTQNGMPNGNNNGGVGSNMGNNPGNVPYGVTGYRTGQPGISGDGTQGNSRPGIPGTYPSGTGGPQGGNSNVMPGNQGFGFNPGGLSGGGNIPPGSLTQPQNVGGNYGPNQNGGSGNNGLYPTQGGTQNGFPGTPGAFPGGSNWPTTSGSFRGADGLNYFCCVASPNGPQLSGTGFKPGTVPNQYVTGAVPGGQGSSGQFVPGVIGGPGTGGQYSPGGTGTQLGPGSGGGTGGQFGPGLGSGQYGPGTSGSHGPGGQFGPGAGGGHGTGGAFGPGPGGQGSSGQFGPGAGGGQGTGGQFGPGTTGGQYIPGGTGTPGAQGGGQGTGGQYGPLGIGGGGNHGSQFSPEAGGGQGTGGQFGPGTGAHLGPGSGGGHGTGGQFIPSTGANSGSQFVPGTDGTGGQFGPGVVGGHGIGGQYGPVTGGGTGGHFAPGTGGGQGTGGQFGPGTGGGSGGQFGPGSGVGLGTGGQFVPITGSGYGGQFGPGATGTGGQFGPGSAGSTGGQFGPGIGGGQGTGGQFVPGTGGQFGPGTAGGQGTGGQFGPGTGSGSSGQFGPGTAGRQGPGGGQFGPDTGGGSGGQFGPGAGGGQYGPGAGGGLGTGGQFGPGAGGGQGTGGQFGPGAGGGQGTGGQFGPGVEGGKGTGGQFGPGTGGGTGGQFAPGAGGGQGTVGQFGPGAGGGTGGQFGPGAGGGTGGQFGPGTGGGTGGQFGPGTGGGTGGQFAPGAGGGQGTGGQFRPGTGGGTGGQFSPGAGGGQGTGGQFGPGTGGGTGGQFGPGAGGGQGTGGQFGPGTGSGTGGQFTPGAGGEQGTGGQFGPGTGGGTGGQFGPGAGGGQGTGGQFGPGTGGGTGAQFAPGAGGGQGTGGQFGLGTGGGTGGQFGPGAGGGQGTGGQFGPGSGGDSGGQFGPGAGGGQGTGGQYGPGAGGGQGTSGQVEGQHPYGDQYGSGGLNNQAAPGGNQNGAPQNVIDPNSIADGDDSEAEASVNQAANGTVASASSKGGNDKGRAQTNVHGTYTGSGSFSAQAEITGENKAANSEVTGDKKGASSTAQGSGRNNKSQANVKLGSETGSVLTGSQSEGTLHSSNSQVQGSVKGGMADAQARGPGSTSSQAQIGFTPYKEGDKSHDLQKTPFVGGGIASAQSSGRTGMSQSQLHGTFKYGITYNGAAQAGASLDKDAVFPNRLPFDKIDVYDENNKNINVDEENVDNTEKAEDLPSVPQTELPTTEVPFETDVVTDLTKDEPINQPDDPYGVHKHADHHTSIEPSLAPTRSPPVESRRSFQTPFNSNNGDYEYSTDKDDNPPDDYDVDDGFGPEGSDPAETEQTYNEFSRDPETTHQSLHSPKRKGVEVRQTTGGNTQHILLGSLADHDAEITQKNSERPDESRIYQPGERIPGTGGYTIPIGFTGSVKSVASKEKTYVVGSKESPSQAQTVSLSPGSGRVKYKYPTYGRNINPKNLRSLYNSKSDDNNRYVSVSKSVTRALDGENNVRKQYSHTYYTKSSSCGYFTFTCTMVSSAEGRKKVCKPKIPTNPDGTPMRCN